MLLSDSSFLSMHFGETSLSIREALHEEILFEGKTAKNTAGGFDIIW
jgi:hypothetical protein